jgi:hypothetical protein
MVSVIVQDARLAALAKARQIRQEKARNSVVTTEIPSKNRLAGVGAARRSSIERRLCQMPNHCRRVYLRAVGGRSPRAAIKSFCLECVGWQRSEVRRCTALACPLWPYRPGHGRVVGTERATLPPVAT